MYDLIIVGAGPAGLTAALYALRSNKKVLIFEAKNYGGQIINAAKIENYPGIPIISGVEYATILYEQVKKFGGEIKFETVIHIDEEKKVTTNKATYQAKAIILATGAEKRKLGIENESKYIGKGISYCATCDGNFYKNKEVALVSGGNTALEDALYLSDLANKVYIINKNNSFDDEENIYEELKKKENVIFMFNTNVIKINGKDKLESIDVQNNDENKTINIQGLFIEVGQEPQNRMFNNIVNLNESGYVISADGVHTSFPGIYVAGDAREKVLRQLTTAVGDGANAAIIAIKEMN